MPRTRPQSPRAPKLSDIGEDRLVAELLSQLPPLSKDARATMRTKAGEDDCAVVRPPGAKYWQLLKTDCLIAGVHYTTLTPPEQVGWKALCRPLSDIAATGGQPLQALITLALPKSKTVDYAKAIYAGIARAAEAFGVTVAGGETARSPGAGFISVCLTGKVSRKRCVTRAGGRAGDRLYVTGRLGGSFASGRHLDFRPRLAEAHWLVSHFRVRAMMDLSDGLAADLPRLARASGVGYSVDPATIPLSAGCTVEQAVSDGEDYELLFAIGPKAAVRLENAWREKWQELPLTCIGSLAETGKCDGLAGTRGFDHFKS